MLFPKIIHQTWKTCSLPEAWKESMNQWLALHPDWSYHFTTDQDNLEFVEKHFRAYLKTYNALPHGIQRADMIRYMYLYHFGGLYSDLDIVPLRNILEFTFDNYNGEEVFAVNSGNIKGIYTNAFMISKPGSKIWIEMLNHIQNYWKWPFTIRHLEVMNSTGPLAYTKVLNNNLQSVYFLPDNLFVPFSSPEIDEYDCKAEAIKLGLFTYPIAGNSWHEADSTVLHYVSKCIIPLILVALYVIINKWKTSRQRNKLT